MDPSVSNALAPNTATSRRTSPLDVMLVGPSLRNWIGGQEVQLDSLARGWTGDSSVQVRVVPNNPKFPAGLAWVECIPLLRTLLRLPFYLRSVWRASERADIVH